MMPLAVAVALNARVIVVFCTLSTIADFHQKQTTSSSSHPLVVASILVEPYLMVNADYSNATDPHSNRYIGYVAELIEKLSHVIGFSYVIKPVQDGSYGYLRPDGTWDGIIGEIVKGKATLAAAPVYVTKQRARVVDFTDLFLTVYATLLMRRHVSTDDGGQQQQPLQQQHQQGMIRSIKELVNQTEVRYGTLNKGVLVRAFKRTNVSLYKTMWRQMQRFDPSVFTSTNEEGIDRLRRRPATAEGGPQRGAAHYAFILPHTIAEYVSLREPCDLVTVGRFLVHRGYALAVRKESPLLRRQLNDALRRLAGTGYMDGLYRKWWFGRSDCDRDGGGAVPLGMMVPRSQKVYSVVRNRAVADPPPGSASSSSRATTGAIQRPIECFSVFLLLLLLIRLPMLVGLNGGH